MDTKVYDKIAVKLMRVTQDLKTLNKNLEIKYGFVHAVQHLKKQGLK